MIDTSIFWLRAAACLYAIGLLHSMLSIVRRSHSLYPVALGTFRVGVVLHAVALVELSMAYGRLPLEDWSSAALDVIAGKRELVSSSGAFLERLPAVAFEH